MLTDTIVHKCASIERVVKRIEGVYHTSSHFENDLTSQESVIFNLQRACQACIDIANATNKHYQMSPPYSADESFELMSEAGLISKTTKCNLQQLDYIKTIAVRDPQHLDTNVLAQLIENRICDFQHFIGEVKSIS
ncbi:type VII toxin-antitoxin system HepT family RNase toxin [Marinomonas sp. TW1]|uniref:type VII toxin-antitoxin system HepT family RNase toxin n=1 Tax=Marinomonas sp. TW1 TaxID=1561203 RepID=UPI0007AF5DCF|nr:HepT-like ribonuclease domain-containing protein [Marinomonas sp. TW1]KZN12527.1 hypothetical protein OA79_15590 [Marinomonas sp. TW1]